MEEKETEHMKAEIDEFITAKVKSMEDEFDAAMKSSVEKAVEDELSKLLQGEFDAEIVSELRKMNEEIIERQREPVAEVVDKLVEI